MRLDIQPKKILLVEDNPEVRIAISQALSLENYSVFTAENGLEALASLEQQIPDLILSDINMPQMNGVQFYKRLREDSRCVAIPFIFLTANDAREDIQAGLALGVEDYLVKPVDLDALLNIINARLLRATEIQLGLIGQAYLETVKVLANTIEARDPYTRGHVERVSTYARGLAEELGWPEGRLRTLEFGARLHDIGKIIIPDEILKKREPLTKDEWAIVQQHPQAGARMIEGISLLKETIPFILHHHEKWNGSGYPNGLAGKHIPVEGRIMAIVDVYDALTTERPYHPPLPHDKVSKYLLINAGTLFDPHLTPIFIRNLEKKNASKADGNFTGDTSGSNGSTVSRETLSSGPSPPASG